MTADRTSEEYQALLAEAIAVLTAAARLTRPVMVVDDTVSSTGPGGWVWIDTGDSTQVDWAEFVTLTLAGAAANVGSIEGALAGRPGSWEADYVRQLLTSTVGQDEANLRRHRTEPPAGRR